MSLLNDVQDPSPRTLQLLQHMLAWRRLVISRIKGEDAKIEIGSEDDWPNDPNFTLEIAKKELRSTNDVIIDLLDGRPDLWFREKIEGTQYNYQFLIEGIIQHDIYHIAQIAILK